VAVHPRIFRPSHASTGQAEHMRQIAENEVLQEPLPETFLGRMTQEPFLNEDDE
jgi:hypothetical protein